MSPRTVGTLLKLTAAGLLIAVPGTGVRAQAVPVRPAQATPSQLDRPDDSTYVARVLENATPLCDSGQARNLSDLKKELDRTTTAELVAANPATAAEMPLPELYARRCQGILTIARTYKCDKCHRWHFGNAATAFAITNSGILVTCRHVFEINEDGPMIAADQLGNVYPVRELLASSSGDDVAILKIDLDAAQPAGAPALEPIPLRAQIPVGSNINVLSHPGNQHYVLTRGIVSRRLNKLGGISGRDSSRRATPTPVVNITAEYAVGSSGAPVMDDAGNVVAMVVSTSLIRSESKRDADPQMVIRNCIAAEQIQRMLHPADQVTVGTAEPSHP